MPDRLVPFTLAGGIAALLLVGIEARLAAPAAALGYVVTALTLTALAIFRRVGRGIHLSGVILAAGAAQAVQGVYFLFGGELVLLGPVRELPWAASAFGVTCIVAGVVVVIGELRRWTWPLVLAASAVTAVNVALLTAALESGSWVAVLLHGLLAVFVVRTLWARVPVSVGSRIVGGFGAVLLATLVLGFGLSMTGSRAKDLDAAVALGNDLRVEVTRLSVIVQHMARVQDLFVISGEDALYFRAIELGNEVSAAAQRLHEITVDHPLGADAEDLARFLQDWAADLGDATSTARQKFLRTGSSTDVQDKYRVVTERVLDFEIAERTFRNALDREAQERTSTITMLASAGTTIIVLLAALFAIVLARTIGHRTARLNESAVAIASGRLDEEHLELREGGDELDELARSFHAMRGRLVDLAAAEAHRSAELSSVLEAVTEFAIIGVDNAGVVTTFNSGAEKMLGWTSEEMLGSLSLGRILDGAEVAARAGELGLPNGPDVIVGRARTGAVDRQDWTYIRKDGTRLTVEVTVSPRRDRDGHITGFLGIARDRTAQNEFEAALTAAKVGAEAADRAKSAFLADMSHELRTPLNAILGFSELLTEQLGSIHDGRHRRFLSNIHVAGEHLLGLINDVLDLSTVESGRLETRPEVIDLGALIEPAIAAARVAAERAGLTFTCAETPSGPVRLDVARTRQILFNLLSNAVKFTVAPGTVNLDVTFRGDSLVMSVADSGIGIPSEETSRVFGVFERVNRDRSDALGTGLGLALTKRLVELQGGTISFDSVVGVGTTFTVMFPDARSRAIRSEAILIVEDERADAGILAALASEAGLRRTGTVGRS